MQVERTSLTLRLVAQLDIAAASGIVARGDELWVIADDELGLAGYDHAGRRTGTLTLLPGMLPESPRERKAHKPDFEALLSLPDESLLALGSGSTVARRRGAWTRFSDGIAESCPIDLSPLYIRLERELLELNIEGGVVLGEALYLCSRGNGARGENALVRLDWPTCALALLRTSTFPAEALREVTRVQLGQLAGQALSFTDLAVGAGRLLFTAAAEASPNTYDDGVCVGSALGVLTPHGVVRDLVELQPVAKIEGIWAGAAPAGEALELWFVADPDDRSARAPLMAASYRPPDP